MNISGKTLLLSNLVVQVVCILLTLSHPSGTCNNAEKVRFKYEISQLFGGGGVMFVCRSNPIKNMARSGVESLHHAGGNIDRYAVGTLGC